MTSGIGDVSDIIERANQRQINLRMFDDKTVSSKGLDQTSFMKYCKAANMKGCLLEGG